MNSLIESIKQMFEGLNTWGWIGQISGLVAFIIILISFQCNKKNYCLLAGISMILFLIEATTSITSMANFMVCLISLIRNLWMYIRLKKGRGELTKGAVWGLLAVLWIGQIAYMIFAHGFGQITSYFTPVSYTHLTLPTIA